MQHKIKCWPEPFLAVVSGWKKFEFRKNDRDYQVGDKLLRQEYDPIKEEYTGESCDVGVTYALHGPAFGVPPGYVVLSIDLAKP